MNKTQSKVRQIFKYPSKAASKLVPLHLITMGGAELNCSFSITAKGHISFTVSLDDLRLGRFILIYHPIFLSFQYFIFYFDTIISVVGLLPPGCALMLIGLGCQLSSLSETQVEHLYPNMFNILSHRLIYARQATVEAVRLDPAKFVQKLQRAMVFVIRATSAHSYAVSVLPSDIEPSFLIGQSALRLAHLKHRNPFVDKALHPLGGLKLLVYLYMKCVNDSLPGFTQLIAMDMLLSCLQRESLYTDAATKLKVNSMLARTLASPLAVIDDSIVEAVIRDPNLLVALCTHSDLWRGSRFYYWRHMIAAIATVLNPTSCRILFKFNRFQLTSLDMLSKFLHCLLEMIQDPVEFDDFPLQDAFMDDVVSIVQALLGFPELPQPVTHLWHFVFLSHPASFTYIDHKVQGHSEWLATDFIRDDGEGELLGDSKLCLTLKQYLQVLGKESIAELWQRGTTLFEIRRQFEQLLKASGDVSEVDQRTAENKESKTKMPDLISDIPSLPINTNSDVADDIPTKFILPSHDRKTERRWVIAVRAGLMNVMAAVLQNGADSLLSCMQHDVISWQAIVVLMSHQTDVRIRNAVVEMLEKFLMRAPPFPKMAFLRLSGFQILANQLRSQPVTSSIVDSLFSMMCGETVRLGDGLDQSHLANMSVDRMSCESLHAIFVAFEESVLDPSLFWNISNALLKTFENNVQLQQAMVDCHLVDAMVNTLRRIAYLDKPW
uniref:DUF4704 domain-containing protein n=1 Tax=Heterorhabditis bacteriophora TaxID=37862 RepID=A0A1I7WSP4_HETBA